MTDVEKMNKTELRAYVQRLEESNQDIMAHVNALDRELKIEKKMASGYKVMYEIQLARGLRDIFTHTVDSDTNGDLDALAELADPLMEN